MATDAIVLGQITQAIAILQDALTRGDDDAVATKALEAIVPIHRAAIRAAANGI